MRRYALILFAFLALPIIARAQATCSVTAYVYSPGGVAVDSARIDVLKVVKGGLIVSSRKTSYYSDSTGLITIPIIKNSTAYLYGSVWGLNSNPTTGTALTIPNADTASLQWLVPATTVPTGYIVSVPFQKIKSATDSGAVNSVLFTGATVTFSGTSFATVALAATGITTASLRDTLDLNSRGSFAMRDTNALHAQREKNIIDTASLANRMGHTAITKAAIAQDTASNANKNAATALGQITVVNNVLGGKGDSDSLSTTTATANQADANAGLALQRARLDSVISQGGNLDVSAAGTHPDIIVFTGFGHLILGQRSAHKFGKSYTLVNKSGGIAIIDYYGTGEDPDGWSGYDTVANDSWQRVINDGVGWRVQRSDVTLAVLADSLNRNAVRPAALTPYVNTTRLTDTLSANVVRTGAITAYPTIVRVTDTLSANVVRSGAIAAYLKVTALTDTLSLNITRGPTLLVANVDDTTTALVTATARGISSTARMFVADDSITFVGEAGDVIDAATGNVFRGTLAAADTLSVTNMVDGQIISIVITNAGTNALGWSGINWAGGTAPTMTSGANKRDVYTLIRAGGVVYGSYVSDLR